MNNKRTKNPLLSIVTICYNDCKALSLTIDSVKSQNFKDFEYIIIDGGSVDGTLSLIKNNENFIDKWISEKDNGIYDAFNKGIRLSKGKYVHLLNAGDLYLNDFTLSLINNNENSDFICFSVLKKSKKDWIWNPTINKLSNFVDVSHPGLIVKRKIYNDNFYSTNYNYVSDNLFISNNVLPEKTKIYNEVLVEMSDGGYSTQFSFKHELEKHKLLIFENVRSKERINLHAKFLFFFFIKLIIHIKRKIM